MHAPLRTWHLTRYWHCGGSPTWHHLVTQPDSPTRVQSVELLQLRRNRAARAGRDSTVDMNQSILLGDEKLVKRLLDLLAVMNRPIFC